MTLNRNSKHPTEHTSCEDELAKKYYAGGLFPRSAHVITITFGRQYPLNGRTVCIRTWSLQYFAFTCSHPKLPSPISNNTKSFLVLLSHMRYGLPTGLLPQNILLSTLFGILVLSVWTTWPAHHNLSNLIYFTTSDPFNNSFSSSLCLSLHPDLSS
jgi:hypothetical protein